MFSCFFNGILRNSTESYGICIYEEILYENACFTFLNGILPTEFQKYSLWQWMFFSILDDNFFCDRVNLQVIHLDQQMFCVFLSSMKAIAATIPHSFL